MKKIFFLSLLALISLSAYSQNYNVIGNGGHNLPLLDQKPIHWGFSFGLNKTDFTIYKSSEIYTNDTLGIYGIETTSMPGFFLGPVLNFRLSKYVDMRFLIDISFTQRNFKYYMSNSSKDLVEIKVPSSFIELPILLKFKGQRLNNLKPYFILGTSGKYDLASLRKINPDEPHINIAPFDMYLELGPGFDFYLPYFKFSIELKYSNGFFDLIENKNTIYSKSIEELKSHSFMLSFHFEG